MVLIKNPFKFSFVKKRIEKSLKEYRDKFIIIKIPVVSEVVYGRKVGYKIRKIKLSQNIEKISATNIRKNYLNEKRVKIICTIGPSSFKKKVLKQLKDKKVDIFRINLSHTNTDQIKSRINFLKKNKIKNICITPEGAQIRTTQCNKKFF